ncbi:MAG: hypothetical protein KDD53_00420 [Bdellovibrionales bacterium]|nr:hypothetical protein [Bdellovibrionales bacterium]
MITYRANPALEAIMPLVRERLTEQGIDAELLEIPWGASEDEIKQTVSANSEQFKDRLVITDNSLRRHLSDPKLTHFIYSIDTILEDQLRVLLNQNHEFQESRKTLLARPSNIDEARQTLGSYHELFEKLVTKALTEHSPDRVFIFPHYLSHHEPFFQNIAFLLQLALDSDKISAAEKVGVQAHLTRIFTSLGEGTENTKMDPAVRDAVERAVGFKFLSPTQLITRSLQRVGVAGEKIVKVEKSRGELEISEFDAAGTVWIIGDTHAFKYGHPSNVANVNRILEAHPNHIRLRLPLGQLFIDLMQHGLISATQVSSIEQLSTTFAKTLTDHLIPAEEA